MTFIPEARYTFVHFMLSSEHIMSSQVLDRFCVAGINYQKADITVRGLFAVDQDGMERIADRAKEEQLRSVFVLSTCNRTEIYGFAESVFQLVHLLTAETKGNQDEFLEYAYLKNGESAIDHLFQVAAGLDSQILGDYEISGQLKTAVDRAAAKDMIGPIMNRTLGYAYQASKKIKATTALSTGTVSVSFAAIEVLRDYPGIQQKKILVIGAGKFGGNVCRNLVQYLPAVPVTVMNRTNEHAMTLAERAGLFYLPYEQKAEAIQAADIIIVCTNAQEPTVLAGHFTGDAEKLVLDLSVPINVEQEVKNIPGVRVIDVDEISASILDKTFAKRKSELPKAHSVLQYYKHEYASWLLEYRFSLHIKSWKDKLHALTEWHPAACEMAAGQSLLADDTKVQKAVSRLAVNLRTNQQKGCQFINAINDYLQMS